MACRQTDIGASRADVVLLHGYAMQADDLSPFAAALNVPATYYFPQSDLAVPGGFAWWPALEQRGQSNAGPRDLALEDPPSRAAARGGLEGFLQALPSQPRALVLGGFSQGGMLALDFALFTPRTLTALILLSSSRIALGAWLPRAARLRGLPIFISHGRADGDLAFEAGEALCEFVRAAGAEVTWCPFEGGHEVPLPVWRQLRKFLREVLNGA